MFSVVCLFLSALQLGSAGECHDEVDDEEDEEAQKHHVSNFVPPHLVLQLPGLAPEPGRLTLQQQQKKAKEQNRVGSGHVSHSLASLGTSLVI